MVQSSAFCGAEEHNNHSLFLNDSRSQESR